MAGKGGDAAGTADDFTIKVGADLNEAEMREVLARLEKSFAQVGEKIISQMTAEFAKFAKTAGKHIDDVSPHIRKAAKSLIDMGDDGEEAFKGIEKQLKDLFRVLDRFGRSVAENVGAMATVREGNRRTSVEVTRAAEDAARAQVEATRAASRAHSVETQRITTAERSAALERIQFAKNEGRQSAIAAQKSAKQRVLITQAALQTIGRLEKGLGITLAGVARTASSAFSKIFAGRGGGIAGAVAKQNSELKGELGRTESIVSTKTREINNSFTEGTNTALNKRERLIRDSFREQETIVRQSAVRQAAAIEGLRKETQTGVVGAANRGLNIGAFLGGAAIFTAVRSTFTVGSEFVRGLAVLQSSLDLTADQMKDVRKLAIDLGNDITLPGVSALDAAQAIQILTKQFGSLGAGAVDAAEKAAKGTLQLARAAGVGAEDAAGIIGAAVNVFKIGADQAVAVADSVAGALSKAAGVSFENFRDSFVQGATVFEQFVGPVESANDVLLDFNTTLAILAKNGITGSTAGAGLKQFFLQANKSGPKAAKLSKELAGKVGETGNLFFEASGKARKYDDSLRILRGSLQGLTDQQRTSTLSTLFGSKSITIANALINTSQKDYDELRKSIQKQGLAAKIAAAQNTGFAGALDALGSVIETAQILLFEKVNPILKTVTLGFATFFNNILSGAGVWGVVRRGLLGIAAGIGAVLAVKGVIELFQLLGTTLTLLATPMGLFLAAAAAIGAAISILADRSPKFVDALRNIRDVLADLGKKALAVAQRALQNFADVLVRDVLPFLEGVATFVSEKVVGAFRFLAAFVTDSVIPALKKMAEFVERNAKKGWDILVRFFEDKVIPIFKRIIEFVDKAILPKLKELAGFVAGELVDALKILVNFLTGSVYPAIFGIGLAFGPTGVVIAAAASAIIFFWDSVRPVLQPAIDGFKTLGDAVSTAFKLGDLSGVGAGLSAAGSGIAKVASTIGGLIVDVLAAAGRALVAGLKEVFSLAHLIAAGKGFLDFVEFVGNTLGKIVTSPKFVTAVAAIGVALAAAATLIAFRFLEGFGKAFLNNLPGLVKLIAKGLLLAIVGSIFLVFKNPLLAAEVVAGFLALFAARKLITGISAAGEKAGGGFLKGFARSAKSSALGFKSIFDGDAFAAYAQKQGFKAGRAMVKEFGKNNSLLVAAGQKAINVPFGRNGIVTEKLATQAQERVDALKKSLGAVGTAALEARAKSLQLTNSLKAIPTAIGNIRGNFDQARANGVGFFSALKTAFQTAGQEISRTALLSGLSIGKVFGTAIAGAAATAVIAIGTFQGGKAEGKSGGSGILSALIGGVTTTAVLGGPENPFALIAGAAVASTGIIGAAFGRAQKKAEDFQNAVKELASTFTDDLVGAINDGLVAVNGFSDIKVDPSAFLTAGDNQDKAAKALADALSTDDLKKINDQFGQGGLNKISQLLVDAGGDATKFKSLFANAMLESGKTARQFVSIAGGDQGIAANLRQLVTDIAAPGGPASILDVLQKPQFLNFVNKFPKATRDVIIANHDLLQSFLTPITGIDAQADAIFAAGEKTTAAAIAIAKIPQAANQAFEHGGTRGIDHASDALRLFEGQIIKTALRTTDSVEGVQEAFEKLGLPPIDQAVVDNYEQQLGRVAAAAEKAQKKVDAIPGRIAAIASLAVADPTQLLQDSAVIQVKADTSGFAEAVANSVNHDFDNPEVRTALAQIGSDVSAAISTGITSGQITDRASLLTFLQPIIDAAVSSAPTDEQKQKIGEFFNALFEGVAVDLPTETANIAAAKFQSDVAQYMKDHPFTTTIQAQFVAASAIPLTGAPGTDLGTRRAGFVAPTQHTLIDDLLPKAEDVKTKAEVVGKAVPVGLTNGMRNPEAITQMLKQVKNLANQSLAQFKQTLGIKSPSKETHDMGVQLTQGLALGIESGADAAAKASAQAAQAAVDAARDVVNKNPVPSPRTSFTDTPEPINDRTRRDTKNFTELLIETIGGFNVFHPNETIPDDVLTASLNKWFNHFLTPDINAVLNQGINNGSIRSQADANAAVQGTKDQFFGQFNSEDRALPIFSTIEKTVTDNFDQITASAQAAIEDHNRLVMANTERILGHGLPAPTPPMSQAEIVDARNRADQLVRDHQRLRGHGIPLGPDDPRAFGDVSGTGDLGALTAAVKSLQETADQLKNKPNETHVNIYETKDPRSTARSTISALRADRLLQHGVR